jgi:isoquinoline 1-oxidoreductase beta subunit
MKHDLTRRTFLQLVGGVGASFAIGSFSSIACAATPTTKREKGETFEPTAFLRIDPDGTCTVTVSKSDMGQGIRTTFAMLVADELDADWSKVKVAQAPGNRSVYGGQGTGGSSSTRSMNKKLRQIGAGARMMLVAAAAKQWGCDPSACKTSAGKVIGPNGVSAGYGELISLAKLVPVPTVQDSDLKKQSDYKIIGKPTNRVDNPDVVTGKAMFSMDVRVDGMVYAMCLRPPMFGGTPLKVDDSAARAIPGVLDVFEIPGGNIAVIGKNTWAAMKGREALKATWNNPNENVSTASLLASMKAAVGPHMDMPSGSKIVEATFDLPYLAHAPMEPLNAVADVRDDSAEVWTGSQSPDGVQAELINMGIPADKAIVHCMLLGGGFGRRSAGDFTGEAIHISKKLKKPVKLIWSRECDMQHDLYRPMSHHAMKGAVDGQGNPVAWSHQLVQAPAWGRGGNYGNPGIWYDIPGAGMKQGGVDSPVPTGAWRSVENTQINVVNECFIDELAHAAGQDPFEFRRKLIKNERLRKVLEMAADKAGWGKPLPKGSGRGIACFSGYGSCIAHVVEVTVKSGKIKLDKAVAVVDVGTAVNPRGVEAQVQGAFCDGISTALKAAITIDKGGAVESNWDSYEWAQMGDVPPMEVFVVDSGGAFGGMGEVGYPSGPPAIGNAIFAATGKRVRKFPVKIEELV